jgi:tryptophanyl-tRNA synthetase
MKVTLTGIKPSGMPHLGNYCGAIKPMIEAINNKSEDETIYMFIPDIHVINGGLEPAKIREFTYGMLATYLACGLDPEKVVIYRQSAVRQHAELATLLNNFTPKGMMNRAHSYKAAVDNNTKDNDFYQSMQEEILKQSINAVDNYKENLENSESPEIQNMLSELIEISKLNAKKAFNEINKVKDQNINMGLYTYPILMAADILLYHTNTVPVGKDQIQHIEMARDIANSFNNRYSETFTIPNYESKEDAPEISGLDGRKMSKSYGNHIPMFCNENELKSLVKKIITDSAKPEEPKDITNSTLVQLYALFADNAKTEEYKTKLAKGGFGYGDAKMELFELINSELAEKRERYNELMKDRKALDAILRAGEEKARFVAEKTMRKVRKKMGLVDTI